MRWLKRNHEFLFFRFLFLFVILFSELSKHLQLFK